MGKLIAPAQMHQKATLMLCEVRAKRTLVLGLFTTLEVHMTGQSLLLDVDFATALTAKGPCST